MCASHKVYAVIKKCLIHIHAVHIHCCEGPHTPPTTRKHTHTHILLTDLPTYLARLVLLLIGLKLLPQDSEVRLMCGQAQHDEVGICPIQTVVGVRVVVGLPTLTTNVVHDLVLSFSWYVGI